jgi:hypothetical protein
MKKENACLTPIALAFSSLLMSTGINAAEQSSAAGVVVMAVGNVTVAGGAGGERSLQRRSQIFTGETIITGKESRAQIRFSDGSLVSLQEGSQFRIENYSYQQEKKGDNATYQLLKGSMRTISGAVGKVNRDEYKVETPVATIGIRGTDYELTLHDSDNSGSEELYGYINDGVIHVANQGGNQDFSDNEFFGVAGPSMPPQSLLNPPGFMFNGYVPDSQQSEGNAAGVPPLDPSLVATLTNTENSDLLNSTINPMITPYATVTQLTGFYDYVFDTSLYGGPLPVVEYGPNATSVSSLIVVDFDAQAILGGDVTVTLSDTTIMYGGISTSSLSDTIGKGQVITLSGSHYDASWLTLSSTTGSLSLQFVGTAAQGAIGNYFIAEIPGAKPSISVTGEAIYTQQPSSGW